MAAFGDIMLSRRHFALATSAAAIIGLPSLPLRSAVAQDTAAGDLASLGLPELNITVNADSFDGFPDGDLAAGRYLLTATIAEGLEYGAAGIIGAPAGMSTEDFIAALAAAAGPPPGAEEASPEAADDGGEEMAMDIPLFFYQGRFPGGAGGPGGVTTQVVLDLTPGEWILWGDDPSAGQVPVTFTVSGEMPADPVAPEADVTITMIDFAINVEGDLSAGDHLAHIRNHGAQPHFTVLMKGPDEMTNDDISSLVLMMTGGEAAEVPFNPETDLVPVWQTVQQSIATEQWMHLSLEAGTYAALCFFPTAGEGLPHAAHGMHTVFSVV